MTKQEVFDTVVSGLLQQGRPSFGGYYGCAYRGTDNLKCAVGFLIKDDEYTRDMENDNFEGLIARNMIPMRLQSLELYTLICDLQYAHDGILADPKKGLPAFREWAKGIAKVYNLDDGVVYQNYE